jgi:hypothetical protein
MELSTAQWVGGLAAFAAVGIIVVALVVVALVRLPAIFSASRRTILELSMTVAALLVVLFFVIKGQWMFDSVMSVVGTKSGAPIYLSCSGDWIDDLPVHETFSLVVDLDKKTVTHGGWTLRIFGNDPAQIFASNAPPEDWRYVRIDRVTHQVAAASPGHTGFFNGTCKSAQNLF